MFHYTEKQKILMKIVNPKKYEELYPEVKEQDSSVEVKEQDSSVEVKEQDSALGGDTKKEEEPAAE